MKLDTLIRVNTCVRFCSMLSIYVRTYYMLLYSILTLSHLHEVKIAQLIITEALKHIINLFLSTRESITFKPLEVAYTYIRKYVCGIVHIPYPLLWFFIEQS